MKYYYKKFSTTKSLSDLFRLTLLLSIFSLSACVKDFEDKGRAFFGKEQLATATSNEITVQEGETLYRIAEKNNVKIDDLAKVNRISKTYKVTTGQKLTLPNYKMYKVQKKDTLREIAMKADIEIGILAKMNHIRINDILPIGKELKIPTHHLDAKELKKLNSMDLDTYQSVPVPRVTYSTPEPLEPKIPPIAELVITEKRDLSSKIALKVKDANPNKFMWPVKGKILAKFGATESGLKNDGVTIDADEGAEIKSASAGKVVYVGNELKGYGNLVIVKHKNNILTSYAHQDKVLVKKNDQVDKGQIIGYVGKTGDVDKPQLHFTVRQGKKPLDPENFLAKN